MKDIQSTIKEKYGFDISQTNLLKLYKIDNEDISAEELEQKIADCRKKWNQSINGANEKFAERDRAHLEKADSYEKLLRDKKLRKELFAFYNKTGSDEAGNTEFAREYFSIVATTKKIRKSDVTFFFDYYQEERKNKKAVLAMLSSEFKVVGLGREKAVQDKEMEESEESEDTAAKKRKESSLPIVNLFQETTILKLRKCDGFYRKAKENDALCQRYPALRESLYDFLEMGSIDDLKVFSDKILHWREAVFAQRQERGAEYAPLVDLFNTLSDLLGYKDVSDNFAEFKLLVKYPSLTPYMYRFDNMKQGTLKSMFDIANKEYYFKDINDFLVNYFIPLYDNFNISIQSIKGVVKKAEQKAEKKVNTNKLLNKLGSKLGHGDGHKAPVIVSVLHWMAYWPVFVVYLVLEVLKHVCNLLRKAVIPLFIVLFIAENWLLGKAGEINMLILKKIVSKNEWYPILEEVAGIKITNGFFAIATSLIVILILLIVYVIPPFFAAVLVDESLNGISVQIDWVGMERTFDSIFQNLRLKTLEQFRTQRKHFYKNKIVKAVMNIICVVILAVIIYLIPIGLHYLSEKTGYGQRTAYEESMGTAVNAVPEESSEEASIAEPEVFYVITVSSANIRSGAGTNHNVLTTAQQGAVFVGTGREESAGNGTIWYEIYLDADRSVTGWASQKVIEKQ